ncbi:hypothetical protein ABW21_db0205316 [Orbilia brochopaga]|nr:hypothetical protein ABW21_db0205316 [Drechslerella brochopaga]
MSDADPDPNSRYTFGNFIKEAFLNALGIWAVLAIMTFTGIQKRLDDWAIRKGMEWRERRLQRQRERENTQPEQALEAGTSSATSDIPIDSQAQMTEVVAGHIIILGAISTQPPDTTEARETDGAMEFGEEDRIPVEQATMDYGTQGNAADGK